MNKIGIMQGRLSPPVNNRIQAFPKDTWQEEFKIAKECGFEIIELIFDAEDYENNPLFADKGLLEVDRLSKKYKIEASMVCADYFMTCPFVHVDNSQKEKNIRILSALIANCGKIGIKLIELPFVEKSDIKTEEEAKAIVSCIKECLLLAEKYNIQIGLETSLAPERLLSLIHSFNHPLVKANYDTGNSASLGYDPEHEISLIGDFIANVHIKDRLLGGESVLLGEGVVDFDKVFQMLSKISYRNSFIIQAARGEDDVKVARQYLEKVKVYVSKYLG